MRKKKKKAKMYRYLFPIVLNGCGETAEKAWRDATEAFSLDPGYYDTFKKEKE